jgi:hypothetical protein
MVSVMAAIALFFPNPAACKAIVKFFTEDVVKGRRGSGMLKGNTVTVNLGHNKECRNIVVGDRCHRCFGEGKRAYLSMCK